MIKHYLLGETFTIIGCVVLKIVYRVLHSFCLSIIAVVLVCLINVCDYDEVNNSF